MSARIPPNAIPNGRGGFTYGPTTPLRQLIRNGVSLNVVRARSAALFILADCPLTPSDLCDGPVRS